MEDEKKDEYDIKAQKKVLDETMLMIPNTKTRLEAALGDLTEFMVLAGSTNYRTISQSLLPRRPPRNTRQRRNFSPKSAPILKNFNSRQYDSLHNSCKSITDVKKHLVFSACAAPPEFFG